jgi:hypothetical protein
MLVSSCFETRWIQWNNHRCQWHHVSK